VNSAQNHESQQAVLGKVEKLVLQQVDEVG
jgi:hypothetical protein